MWRTPGETSAGIRCVCSLRTGTAISRGCATTATTPTDLWPCPRSWRSSTRTRRRSTRQSRPERRSPVSRPPPRLPSDHRPWSVGVRDARRRQWRREHRQRPHTRHPVPTSIDMVTPMTYRSPECLEQAWRPRRRRLGDWHPARRRDPPFGSTRHHRGWGACANCPGPTEGTTFSGGWTRQACSTSATTRSTISFGPVTCHRPS